MAIGPNTKVVNLEGKFVTPGFIDSHVHFISGGLQVGIVQSYFVNTTYSYLDKLYLV